MPLKRRLSDTLVLIKSRPRHRNISSSKRYTVTIGVGGNVGDVARRFKHLQVYLQRDLRFDMIETAPILKNPPFGYEDQDDFLNSVLRVKTSLTPHTLLRFLLHTEKHFGRTRSFANAPRTLDLDIIFIDDLKINTPTLQVPHPHWKERQSVVTPLRHMKRELKRRDHG